MSDNAQHTPGPWIVTPRSNKGNGTAWRDIVSTGGEFSPSYVSEALERDSHLIAAAPDLLAACKAVLDTWHAKNSNFYKKEPAYLQQIRSAIAKAEGR